MVPSPLQRSIETELRELDDHKSTLEQALAEARRANSRTDAGLKEACEQIVAATKRAVPDPDDAGIPARITETVEQCFHAATKALHQYWLRICALIQQAIRRAADALAEKKKELRHLEDRSGGRGSAGRY